MSEERQRTAARTLKNNLVTFGFSHECEWKSKDVIQNQDETLYSVEYKGACLGKGMLCIPGLHNVSNAMGAILVADFYGIPLKSSLEALSHFKGINRRLEMKGEYKGIKIYNESCS